jgi:hypothetical protein
MRPYLIFALLANAPFRPSRPSTQVAGIRFLRADGRGPNVRLAKRNDTATYSGMIQHRDEKGRIRRPSGPPHSVPKTRDERSERLTRDPGRFTMRMPIGFRPALDNFARRERKTLTELVLTALEHTYPAVLHPVLHGEKLLGDQVSSIPRFPGQPARLPRLQDQRPSDVTPAIPALDHIGAPKAAQARREQARTRFTGTLTDTGHSKR